MTIDVALFPLMTVLYPGGPLPLRIFEQRYLGMVSRCLKANEGFGVLLIREGAEVGDAQTYDVGTVARIVDWCQGSDGLLGITARGTDRFRVESFEKRPDGLYVGRVALLEPERSTPLSDEFRSLQTLLKGILAEIGDRYGGIQTAYDDASWVGYRLAELLPVPLTTKQAMLEMSDATGRLDMLRPLVEQVATQASS